MLTTRQNDIMNIGLLIDELAAEPEAKSLLELACSVIETRDSQSELIR